MRSLGYLAAALALLLFGTSPALAKVAMIETAAPIKDQSEESVKAALKEAVDIAAKGAVAMGLPWVQVRDARVLEDTVAIQVLATDQAPREANKNDGAPGAEQAPGPGPHFSPGPFQRSKPDQQLQPNQPKPNQPSPSDNETNL